MYDGCRTSISSILTPVTYRWKIIFVIFWSNLIRRITIDVNEVVKKKKKFSN